MPPEEVRSLVAEVIKETGAASIKDMGKAMKVLSVQVAGRADGKLVSDILKEELSKAQ